MNVYLVRHGKYSNPNSIIPGRLPVALSTSGRKQIRRVAKFLSDKNISKIYSSEVLRCKQSSEIISNNCIPITYDKRLLEGLTAVQGDHFDEGDNPWAKYYSLAETLGGETKGDIYNRIKSFWEEKILIENEDFVICSHGDPIYILYLYLIDGNLKSFVEEDLTDNSGYPNRGSIKKVVLENGKVIKVENIF